MRTDTDTSFDLREKSIARAAILGIVVMAGGSGACGTNPEQSSAKRSSAAVRAASSTAVPTTTLSDTAKICRALEHAGFTTAAWKQIPEMGHQCITSLADHEFGPPPHGNPLGLRSNISYQAWGKADVPDHAGIFVNINVPSTRAEGRRLMQQMVKEWFKAITAKPAPEALIAAIRSDRRRYDGHAEDLWLLYETELMPTERVLKLRFEATTEEARTASTPVARPCAAKETVPAARLLHLRNTNGLDAMQPYQNCRLRVSGSVREIRMNSEGNPVVILKGHQPSSDFRCVLEKTERKPHLSPGQIVEVEGDNLMAGTAVSSFGGSCRLIEPAH